MISHAILGSIASSGGVSNDNAAVIAFTGELFKEPLVDQPMGYQTEKNAKRGLRRYIYTYNNPGFSLHLVTQAHWPGTNWPTPAEYNMEVIFDTPVTSHADDPNITVTNFFNTGLLTTGDRVFIDVIWTRRVSGSRSLDGMHPDLLEINDIYMQTGEIYRAGKLASDYSIIGYKGDGVT